MRTHSGSPAKKLCQAEGVLGAIARRTGWYDVIGNVSSCVVYAVDSQSWVVSTVGTRRTKQSHAKSAVESEFVATVACAPLAFSESLSLRRRGCRGRGRDNGAPVIQWYNSRYPLKEIFDRLGSFCEIAGFAAGYDVVFDVAQTIVQSVDSVAAVETVERRSAHNSRFRPAVVARLFEQGLSFNERDLEWQVPFACVFEVTVEYIVADGDSERFAGSFIAEAATTARCSFVQGRRPHQSLSAAVAPTTIGPTRAGFGPDFLKNSESPKSGAGRDRRRSNTATAFDRSRAKAPWEHDGFIPTVASATKRRLVFSRSRGLGDGLQNYEVCKSFANEICFAATAAASGSGKVASCNPVLFATIAPAQTLGRKRTFLSLKLSNDYEVSVTLPNQCSRSVLRQLAPSGLCNAGFHSVVADYTRGDTDEHFPGRRRSTCERRAERIAGVTGEEIK